MGVMEDRVPLSKAEQALRAGDHQAALAIFDATLSIHPTDADALAGRGACLRALGRAREALVTLLEALGLAPTHQQARLELALALRACGRTDEARTLYSLLLRAPDAPAGAWRGLALMALSEGKLIVAETCLRRAIAIDPGTVDARLELADLLAQRDDAADAIELYHSVLAIAPGNAAAHAGLAQALIGLGRLEEAEDQVERALAMQSENVVAHLARARLNLMAGNLPGAWDDLDYRWSLRGARRPEPPGQPWDGEADLHGQTILLWAEPGLGETIHLLRYVPLVAERGAQVVLGLPADLAPLAQGLEGVAAVAVSGGPVPDGFTIDFHASLAELPRLFGTTLATIPPAPYLAVPEGLRRKVEASATAVLKVGVVWSGPRWTLPLGELCPLLAEPGAAFFSLQTGPRARAGSRLMHPSLIADLAPTIGNFADLAARIAEMDVVVTVDGPAAHLAGALGVPTWVLLPQAPDWRWMQERSDSPWYGSVRLFRQSRAGDWERPVQEACRALRALEAETRAQRQAEAGAQSGPREALRAFLTTSLHDGDLLLDVGAGDGTHALDAAAHPGADIRVLAIEARPSEAAILADTIAVAGAEEAVEVIAAPLADVARPAVVSARPRRGRSVFTLPGWVASPLSTTTLDALLAERPALAGRRLVLRLGAKGAEEAVLAGLSAEPALVAFEHRDGLDVAERLRQRGYRLVRFPSAIAAGPVADFDGEDGPVLALAPGLEPAAIYGDVGDPTSPAAMARAAAEAKDLAARGTDLLAAEDYTRAGQFFAAALSSDCDNVQALANLGGLLRRVGRAEAASVAWARALANGASPSIRANLANVLRELGQPFAADELFTQALAEAPDNATILYGLGLLRREQGRARESVGLYERARQLSPGSVPAREYAGALLKSGNLARGMAEMAHRPPVGLEPVAAPAWDGGRLDARTILVRDENDIIDALMLARFIPQVARHGGLVVVECVPDLARLLAGLPGVEQVVPRGQELPPVDVTANLLDVPRLIGTTSRTTPPRDVPYLHLPEGLEPRAFPADGRLRVGIAWKGRPVDRQVPLATLLQLAADPRIVLVSLQRPPQSSELGDQGARTLVEDLGAGFGDLGDTAATIAGLDLVVGGDTPELHLAGAMGKPVWALIPNSADWRWVDCREDCVWYPTMRVFRQSADGSWHDAIARVQAAAAAMAAGKAANA